MASMLTLEEQKKLKMLLDLMNNQDEPSPPKIDVSNRSRDELGRFVKEKQVEFPSESVRKIKLLKVDGTYGTYLVETQYFSPLEKAVLILVGTITILAIIF